VIDRIRRESVVRTLLVAHGHFLRVLATQWIQQPAILAEHLLLGPARIGVLGFDRNAPAIERWNA